LDNIEKIEENLWIPEHAQNVVRKSCYTA